MFVAEATGRPGFVVPGLLAAVVAQLVMGTASVSPYQRRRRTGHVEERTGLPIASVLVRDAPTADAEHTIARFYATHVAPARRRAVAVTDGDGHYAGMLFLTDILKVDPGDWATTPLADVMRRDAPVGRPEWTIGQALAAMLTADVDHLPVLDGDGALVGIASTVDILDLDELLDRLGDDRDDGQPH
jgi:CBS domain-containing protein